MNKTKALATAKEWLNPALMFAIFDCSDSMEIAEALQHRFNAYVDDSVSIKDFVKKHLYKQYIQECIKVSRFEGGENPLEELQSTASELPIPFKDIKADLESALNKPF